MPDSPTRQKPASALAQRAAALLADVSSAHPLVHCLTNPVSLDIAANALLAVGAAPIMAPSFDEVGALSPKIDALVVNIGMLTRDGLEAMEAAATAAHMHGKPWLLDPVGAGGLPMRDHATLRLLRHRPAVLRGNASEIIGVANALGLTHDPASTRGVDSTNSATQAEASVVRLARHSFCTVVATGAVDVVSDGERVARIANGAAMMTRVTALGCSLSAVMGAFLAIAGDPFEAAVAACTLYSVAGEIAAAQTQGPGSFRVAFIDALDAMQANDIVTRARIEQDARKPG